MNASCVRDNITFKIKPKLIKIVGMLSSRPLEKILRSLANGGGIKS